MSIPAVHSVFFFVSDLARSKNFYQEILGTDSVYETNSIVAFTLNGVQIMLHIDPPQQGETVDSQKGKGFALHLEVNDIENYWERLKKIGIKLDNKPTKQEYGVIEFSVHDPDGYEIEFIERI